MNNTFLYSYNWFISILDFVILRILNSKKKNYIYVLKLDKTNKCDFQAKKQQL